MKIKCELHCHTAYSGHSNLTLNDVINLCQKKDIKAIAITDHNEIKGALELKKSAPSWLQVIVGEEISTEKGELIGLFLSKRVSPNLSIEETISQIKEQGGLVLLPHPFDRLRRSALGYTETFRIKDQIDMIEVFNSRSLFKEDSKKTVEFARKHHLTATVGSDAHFHNELGNSICLIDEFKGPKNFLENLKNAQFVTRQSGMTVHFKTKLIKIFRRLFTES